MAQGIAGTRPRQGWAAVGRPRHVIQRELSSTPSARRALPPRAPPHSTAEATEPLAGPVRVGARGLGEPKTQRVALLGARPRGGSPLRNGATTGRDWGSSARRHNAQRKATAAAASLSLEFALSPARRATAAAVMAALPSDLAPESPAALAERGSGGGASDEPLLTGFGTHGRLPLVWRQQLQRVATTLSISDIPSLARATLIAGRFCATGCRVVQAAEVSDAVLVLPGADDAALDAANAAVVAAAALSLAVKIDWEERLHASDGRCDTGRALSRALAAVGPLPEALAPGPAARAAPDPHGDDPTAREAARDQAAARLHAIAEATMSVSAMFGDVPFKAAEAAPVLRPSRRRWFAWRVRPPPPPGQPLQQPPGHSPQQLPHAQPQAQPAGGARPWLLQGMAAVEVAVGVALQWRLGAGTLLDAMEALRPSSTRRDGGGISLAAHDAVMDLITYGDGGLDLRGLARRALRDADAAARKAVTVGGATPLANVPVPGVW